MRAIGSNFGKIEALATLPNRTMGGTKPSQIVQPGSSRNPDGPRSSEQVCGRKLRQRWRLCFHVSRPDRPWQDCDRPDNFCSLALGRDAIARAGGRFELPAVLEYRLRSGFGDDKPEF